jgi:hypothetical protein
MYNISTKVEIPLNRRVAHRRPKMKLINSGRLNISVATALNKIVNRLSSKAYEAVLELEQDIISKGQEGFRITHLVGAIKTHYNNTLYPHDFI